MNQQHKYIKLGIIIITPLLIGLLWRGFISIFLSTNKTQSNNIPTTGEITQTNTIKEEQESIINLGAQNSQTGILRIAIPPWLDNEQLKGLTTSLNKEGLLIKRIAINTGDYHDQVWTMMASGLVDVSLVSSDRAQECTQGCGLRFRYNNPITSFITSSIINSLETKDRTMIPFAIDPLVTFHSNKQLSSESRTALFNNILISTEDQSAPVPLAIGVSNADKALLRSKKEAYGGYVQLLHQILIQFKNNESLLDQLLQLSEGAQLRSYQRANKALQTINQKFPLCQSISPLCLVRFGISTYGFGYASDFYTIPSSWRNTITYSQFPLETSYYPTRLRGFIVNHKQKNTALISHFISIYITHYINATTSEHTLISPFTTTINNPSQELLIPIIPHSDYFKTTIGDKYTPLYLLNNGGMLSVLDRTSSIQQYLMQLQID